MTDWEVAFVVLLYLAPIYGLLGFVAWHDYKRIKAAKAKEEKHIALYERLIELLEKEDE